MKRLISIKFIFKSPIFYFMVQNFMLLSNFLFYGGTFNVQHLDKPFY